MPDCQPIIKRVIKRSFPNDTMLDLVMWIIVFVVAIAVLVKASDYFTSNAEKIGIYYGMPAFLVGVTIVAVGTSLPELISSIFAILKGNTEIVAGNVIGSNIANIFLILGVATIIGGRLKIMYELVKVDLPLLAGSAMLFGVMVWDGVFTFPEALMSLAGFAIYVHYTIKSSQEKTDPEIEREVKEIKKLKHIGSSPFLILIFSAVFIFIGAKYTVDSIVSIATIMNIGAEIIAVTAVAIGTSLPELAVSTLR